MISLWAYLSEAHVEAYASTLVLPDYLAHLRLVPFKFSQQAINSDGQEPLRLTYCSQGRLEEYLLYPKDHVLAMLRFVCPGIKSSKIRLPQDDARWNWGVWDSETATSLVSAKASENSLEPPPRMRIYFEPTTRLLGRPTARTPLPEAYVSVTRGHVFVGRPAVESYLNAWLESLGIDQTAAQFAFDTPSGGVHFTAGIRASSGCGPAAAVGGQMFLSDQVLAEELIRFAGIEPALAQVRDWAKLDLDGVPHDGSGVCEDGIYIQLIPREERRRSSL